MNRPLKPEGIFLRVTNVEVKFDPRMLREDTVVLLETFFYRRTRQESSRNRRGGCQASL